MNKAAPLNEIGEGVGVALVAASLQRTLKVAPYLLHIEEIWAGATDGHAVNGLETLEVNPILTHRGALLAGCGSRQVGF